MFSRRMALSLVVVVAIMGYQSIALAGFAKDLPNPLPPEFQINQGYLYGVADVYTYGHNGTDWPTGTTGKSVYAVADGIVEFSGAQIDPATGKYTGYGEYIIVKHESGAYYSLYAHLSTRSVAKDASVKVGQQIGLSGNTGTSTGPHLHFEIRKTNSYYDVRNPECWLARSTSGGYGGVYGEVTDLQAYYVRGAQITGATKPESGYTGSHTYYVMKNGSSFPDEQAYQINYYIGRANTGSKTLTYSHTDFYSQSKTVTIPTNSDARVSDVILIRK